MTDQPTPDPDTPSDTPDLARRLLDLWQDYLATLVQAPQWVESWQRLPLQATPAPLAEAMRLSPAPPFAPPLTPEAAASQLAPWGAMIAQLFAGLAPGHQGQAPQPDGRQPATAPAPGTAAPGASSAPGRGGGASPKAGQAGFWGAPPPIAPPPTAGPGPTRR